MFSCRTRKGEMNEIVILEKKDEWTCCVYVHTIHSSCAIIFNSFIIVFVGHYILVDIGDQCALSSLINLYSLTDCML